MYTVCEISRRPKGYQATSAKMADVEIFFTCHFHFIPAKLDKEYKWFTIYMLLILMLAKVTDVKLAHIKYLDFTSDRADVPASLRRTADARDLSLPLGQSAN